MATSTLTAYNLAVEVNEAYCPTVGDKQYSYVLVTWLSPTGTTLTGVKSNSGSTITNFGANDKRSGTTMTSSTTPTQWKTLLDTLYATPSYPAGDTVTDINLIKYNDGSKTYDAILLKSYGQKTAGGMVETGAGTLTLSFDVTSGAGPSFKSAIPLTQDTQAGANAAFIGQTKDFTA